ncbi:hypothetical protein [Streptomyces sp. NPDC102476]|uniref:hypothetical protein n=1 Tax=Streptomyces sp. NPDC102476 TaxID=3366181 RepID=UPI00380DD41F
MNLPVPAEPFADVLVYRWSERSLLGGTGVGPVATSLDHEQLRRWDGRLASVLWAAEGSTEDGFLYANHGGTAAVLRKRPVRDQHGRDGSTLTHALIGPAEWLGPGLALALCRSRWEDWLPPYGAEGARERLQRVPLARLRDHLADDAATLDTEASQAPLHLLTPIAAAVLAAPGEPVTVVASPLPAEVVLCALHGVLGSLTAGEWTFATRENSDSGPALPRFVFVGGTDRGSLYAPSERRSVRADVPNAAAPGQEPPDGEELAAQLLAFHRRRGTGGLARLLPPRPLHTAEEVRAWEERHHMAPGVLADVRMLIEDALAGRLEPAAGQHLARSAILPRLELELRRMPATQLAELVRDWTADRPDLARYRPARDAMHREILRRALAPHSRGEGEDELLLTALRASGPDPRIVHETIGEALRSTRGRGDNVDVLHVLQVARGVGLDSAELGRLRRALVDGLPAWALIQQTQRISSIDPDLGRELLGWCTRRQVRGEDRRLLLQTLGQYAFLAAAIDRMADGGPRQAVELYIALIGCVSGSNLRRADVEDVLALAGPEPPATLFKALHLTARSDRVRHIVEEAVTADYFRRHLVRSHHGGRPKSPPRAGNE